MTHARYPTLLLSLLAALASPSRAFYCSTDEKQAFAALRLDERAATTIAAAPLFSDSCKRWLFEEISKATARQYSQGLYRTKSCGDLPAVVAALAPILEKRQDPICAAASRCDAAAVSCQPCAVGPRWKADLDKADAAISSVIDNETSLILAKIKDRAIPYCLLPPECADGANAACQAALRTKWWSELTGAAQSSEQESWLKMGGFLHLLLGSAFTCNVGTQKGSTCTIFSGAALMTHYCATPAANGQGPKTCSASGQGFRCPAPEEFLEKAFQKGAWTSKRRDAAGNWRPDYNNSTDQDVKGALWGGLMCHIYLNSEACRKAKAMVAGVPLQEFLPLYREFGFQATYLAPDDTGWRAALDSLADGHPVQVGLEIKGWLGYPSGGAHAVVLEGHWTDDGGSGRVLLRDSNQSEVLKVMLAENIRQSYFQGKDSSGGGVTLRTGSSCRETVCVVGAAPTPPPSRLQRPKEISVGVEFSLP